MNKFFKKNNYFFGALLAIVAPTVFYVILYLLSLLLIKTGIRNVFSPPENIYLLSLIVNIVLFRIYLIRLKAEKTGRSLLLVTIVLILVFFYLYFRNPS